MPNYTVTCDKCGHTEDIVRSLSEHGNWPKCHGKMRQIIKSPQLTPDIQPYKAIATDVATGKPPVIGSRREHKEFLRRNNYVEVGNEKMSAERKHDTVSKQEIKRVMDQIRSR